MSLETNEAGEPEQIFSTEESISDRSNRSANRQRSSEEIETHRSNDELAIGSLITTNDEARSNATDDQPNDSTPIDSLNLDSIPTVENKDCEYLKLVLGFKRTLVLPDVFFAYETPICYCASCVSCARSSILTGLYYVLIKVVPKLYPYTRPLFNFSTSDKTGWVRFKLNQQVLHANKSNDVSNISDWTNAFYLSRVDKIRAILDHGQPLPIGKEETSLNRFIQGH